MNTIPLSTPNLSGNELKYLTECIETNFVSSVGRFVIDFEDRFADYLGVKRAVAVMNGTSALLLSLIALGVKRDDEVLVPNLTFVAPLNAVKYLGAHPVLIDSDYSTLGMSPKSIEYFLKQSIEIKNGESYNKTTGRRVAAIMPMHTLGVAVEIEPLLSLAKEYNIKVIEDASESLGAKYQDVHTGTLGDCGCFSFNGNKIITSGGGGMIATNNTVLADQIKHLSTTAKTDAFNFIHDEVGYNYRMVNLLAAVGLAQLEQLEEFLLIKKNNAKLYAEKLKNIKMLDFYMPEKDSQSNFWFYSLILKPDYKHKKQGLMSFLINHNIVVRPIWCLMENLPMYKESQKTNMSVSNDLHDRIINIPCSTNLTDEQITKVCETIRRFEEQDGL